MESNNSLIVKTNNLIEGFMDMSTNEYKLTLLLISKIKKEDKEFRKQEVSVKEFSKLIGSSEKKMYTYFRSFTKTLLTRSIEIKHPDGEIIDINWFSYARYKKNRIEIAFNNDLKSFLLNINVPYTKYFLRNVKGMRSKYSVRVYELLKQYEKLKERTIDYLELKCMLGIGVNEYKLYNDFKRRVILTSQKELKKYTDIYFEFEEIKDGKKIVSVKFIIKSKDINDIVLDRQVKVDEVLEKTDIDNIINDFRSNYNLELNYSLVKKLIENKGIDCVRECVNNIKEYVRTITQQNFFDFTMKYGTEKAYTKTGIYNNNQDNKPQQSMNYEQREYDDDFFNSLYDNIEFTK